MVKILIPSEKLKDGLKKEANHIESLLEASQILYYKKKYSLSLPLSVLALEEVTKLRMIRDNYLQNNGITTKEWFDMKKGGSHKVKLTKPSSERKKRLYEMGEPTFEAARKLKTMINDPLKHITYSKMKEFTKDGSPMEKLDKIKQDCFYLDWKNSKWSSARIKLSKNQLQAMAHVSLEITKWFLNQAILYSRHPEIELDENSESFKKYLNDPLLKKDKDFKKKFQSNKFRKELTMATKILENY